MVCVLTLFPLDQEWIGGENTPPSVYWDGLRSDTVSLRSGVMQGGVMSPVFFAIYVMICLNGLKI